MEFAHKLKTLLVIAFAKLRDAPCSWSDVPLMRRTTPSAGSRHPTEAYLVCYNIADLPQGWYHIQVDPCELVLINNIDKTDSTLIINDQKPCNGLIILTSNFTRTMYRYREPRSFRVTHADVGHMLTTLEILAQELNICMECHLNFNEQYILHKINASNLDEGVIAVASIDPKI